MEEKTLFDSESWDTPSGLSWKKIGMALLGPTAILCVGLTIVNLPLMFGTQDLERAARQVADKPAASPIEMTPLRSPATNASRRAAMPTAEERMRQRMQDLIDTTEQRAKNHALNRRAMDREFQDVSRKLGVGGRRGVGERELQINLDDINF